MKLTSPGRNLLEQHYTDLKEKPFYAGLISCKFSASTLFLRKLIAIDMLSGPVVAMVWEGKDVVKTGRTILGATNPLASAPGTIRGDYAIDVGRNVCHGSDSVESAKKEIGLWFSPSELINWKHSQAEWIYE